MQMKAILDGQGLHSPPEGADGRVLDTIAQVAQQSPEHGELVYQED